MSFLIGISGNSGSGKTTFINELKRHFSNDEVCIISQDDFYKPINRQQKDEKGVTNFDLPSAIDVTQLYETIKDVSQGKEVSFNEYTFNNSDKKSKIIVKKPAPIIIVEGVFVFHYTEINDLLDMRIMIASEDIKSLIRRIKRDGDERGYDINDVLYRYEAHVYPACKKYIQPHANEVDMIINNNEGFQNSLHVVKAYLKSLLPI